MLRIKSFESLRNPVEVNETELFDVIGRLVEIYSPVQKLIAGKAATLIDFVIVDTQDMHLKCTVWDEHVAAIHQFYNIDVKQPIIVAIQLCRAKIVNGEVRINSSYDATKLWINHSFAEFAEFRSKLAAENSPHRSITITTVLSDSTGLGDLQSGSITITTLSDLLMKEEDGDYYVPAQIVGIEGSRKGDWYYTSCMSQGCNKKLTEGDQGLVICGKCKKKWDQGCVRYKVVVRVVDKRDDAPFLLWDRECADLVGVPASLLFEKYLKEDIDILPELESLIGRSMIFKLSLKRDQMRGPTSAYNVMRVIMDQALVDEYCSRLNDTQEKDLISRMIEEDDDDSFDSDEEGSKGDEVNSPVNATQEKGKETDSENSDTIKRCLLDQFSTSTKLKKSRMINVKTEKI
nr:replication factor A protein 1-like [Ipomoea batatas]